MLPAAPVAEAVSEDLGEVLGEPSGVEKGELYFPKDFRRCRPPGDDVPAAVSPLAAEDDATAGALSFSAILAGAVVVVDLGTIRRGIPSRDILRGLALTTVTEPCKRDVKPMRPPARGASRSVSLIGERGGVGVQARLQGRRCGCLTAFGQPSLPSNPFLIW